MPYNRRRASPFFKFGDSIARVRIKPHGIRETAVGSNGKTRLPSRRPPAAEALPGLDCHCGSCAGGPRLPPSQQKHTVTLQCEQRRGGLCHCKASLSRLPVSFKTLEASCSPGGKAHARYLPVFALFGASSLSSGKQPRAFQHFAPRLQNFRLPQPHLLCGGGRVP